MEIIISNRDRAQARRTLNHIIKGFHGWIWQGTAAANNGQVTVFIGFESARAAAQSGPMDEPTTVHVSTDYFTPDTMWSKLTPAMRERATVRGQSFAEYREAVRAKSR